MANNTVSIILPIRNEEKYIKQCLDSILSQNYKFIELFIVDGMSTDSTRELLIPYLKKHQNIILLDNPQKITPVALNMGIKKATGDIVIRMDGHATYQFDYVSKCVEFLDSTQAANVGGIRLHKGFGFLGNAVSFAETCIFGLGGAKFRTAQKSQFVDTVFLGAWFRKTFDIYGYFNEKLERNQDIEFNARIRKNGGKIFLTPEIVATYYVRSNLWNLFKQNFRNGLWNIKTMNALSIRHFVPLIFVLSLMITYFIMPILWITILTSYILCSLFFSFKISVENGFKYFFIMPIIFAVLHISYGLGMLTGMFRGKL